MGPKGEVRMNNSQTETNLLNMAVQGASRFVAGLVMVAVTCHLACVATAQAQTSPVVHDPFIFLDGKVSYLFGTGDGVSVYRSEDLMEWTAGGQRGRVYQTTPTWAQKIVSRRPAGGKGGPDQWSPSVYFFNNKFHLYTCVGVFGTNDMAIGLSTNTTLDPTDAAYKWVNHGVVIESRPQVDDFAAMTAHVVEEPQGAFWLLYGGNFSGVKLVRLNPATGKPMPGEKPTSLASRPRGGAFQVGPVVEGPFLFHRGEYWYLFVSFDNCCKGVESTYNIRVGRSRNITGPFNDRASQPLTAGGGTTLLRSYDNVKGPGSNQVITVGGNEYFIHHYYDADRNGSPRLGVRQILWAEDGWPLLGEFLRKSPLAEVSKNSLEGRWEHSVDFNRYKPLVFEAGGRIAGGRATWKLNGRRLLLTFPDPAAPGGAWVNHCVLSADGDGYVCRYGAGDGLIIRGRRMPD